MAEYTGFGYSFRAVEAMNNGLYPASHWARRIGLGLTAGWIAAHCEAAEWHHCAANVGGGGNPTDFYRGEHVAARWLAANALVAGENRVARRRLDALIAICEELDVEDSEIEEALLADVPLPVRRAAVPAAAVPNAELLGRHVAARHDYWRSSWSRSGRRRYERATETVSGRLDAATEKSIIIAGRRYMRTTISHVEAADGQAA